MLQVDVPFALGVGSLVADAAREQLRTGDRGHFYRGLALTLLYILFCVLPLPIYYVMAYFGFQTSHMWWHGDSVADYPKLIPLFIPLFTLACVAGYVAGAKLIRQGKDAANRAIYFGVLAFSLFWIFGMRRYTWYLGTYDEWSAGHGILFYKDSTFLMISIAFAILVIAPLTMLYRYLRREGRALSSAQESAEP